MTFLKKTGNNFGDPQGSNTMSIGLESFFWVKYSPATPFVDIQYRVCFCYTVTYSAFIGVVGNLSF